MKNDLGVDPFEWFDTRFINPLDSMPIAKDELMEESSTKKDIPAELMEVPTSGKNPKPELKKEKTPHHIAYEIATAKYNPFAIGGSESIHDFQGGSEQCQQ